MNLYCFIVNAPSSYYDPIGLWKEISYRIVKVLLKRVQNGSDIAADELTWEEWEAECNDTISGLIDRIKEEKLSNLSLGDWPQWLSLEEPAPGRHNLPDLIQPGDIFKVKVYGVIKGRVNAIFNTVRLTPVQNATVLLDILDGDCCYYSLTNEKGNYAFIVPEKYKFEVFVNSDDMLEIVKMNGRFMPPIYNPDAELYGVDRSSSSEKYVSELNYGEIRTHNFLLKLIKPSPYQSTPNNYLTGQ